MVTHTHTSILAARGLGHTLANIYGDGGQCVLTDCGRDDHDEAGADTKPKQGPRAQQQRSNAAQRNDEHTTDTDTHRSHKNMHACKNESTQE